MSKQEDLSLAVDLVQSGDLDAGHRIAQTYEGDPLADTLHAIIHRRDGDYSNSMYWWSRVGASIPAEILAVVPDPKGFVTRVKLARPGTDEAADCQLIASLELDALKAAIDGKGL